MRTSAGSSSSGRRPATVPAPQSRAVRASPAAGTGFRVYVNAPGVKGKKMGVHGIPFSWTKPGYSVMVHQTLNWKAEDAMSVTLNLKPEIEAGLAAHAQATGMTLEGYLQHLVAKDLSVDAVEAGSAVGNGMVWEDGLLIYGAGTPLPAGFIDDAVRRSREVRSQHLLGRHD